MVLQHQTGADTRQGRPGSSFCSIFQIKFKLKQLHSREGVATEPRNKWRIRHAYQCTVCFWLDIKQTKASCLLTNLLFFVYSHCEISMSIVTLIAVMDERSTVCSTALDFKSNCFESRGAQSLFNGNKIW